MRSKRLIGMALTLVLSLSMATISAMAADSPAVTAANYNVEKASAEFTLEGLESGKQYMASVINMDSKKSVGNSYDYYTADGEYSLGVDAYEKDAVAANETGYGVGLYQGGELLSSVPFGTKATEPTIADAKKDGDNKVTLTIKDANKEGYYLVSSFGVVGESNVVMAMSQPISSAKKDLTGLQFTIPAGATKCEVYIVKGDVDLTDPAAIAGAAVKGGTLNLLTVE